MMYPEVRLELELGLVELSCYHRSHTVDERLEQLSLVNAQDPLCVLRYAPHAP